MNSMVKLTLGIVLVACGTSAMAFDKGLYIGASVGQASSNVSYLEGVSCIQLVGSTCPSSTEANVSGTDTAYKVLVGVRPLKWFAVEASYVDLGKPKQSNVSASTSGISGFAVGFLDLGPVDLFAKAGGINTSSSISYSGIKIASRSSTDFAYGAGIQVSVLAVKIRGEYERFETGKGTNMASVGVVFTFL